MKKIPKGGRQQYVYFLMHELYDLGYDKEEALKTLQQCNRDNCEPPLTDKSVARVFRGAWRRRVAKEEERKHERFAKRS